MEVVRGPAAPVEVDPGPAAGGGHRVHWAASFSDGAAGEGGGGGGPGPGGGGGSSGPLGGIILGRRGGYGGRGGNGPVIMGPHTKSAGTEEIARRSGGDSMPVDNASALDDTLARIRQRYAL